MKIPLRFWGGLLPALIACSCLPAQQPAPRCPVFPADNVWNTPVDTLPLDPHSALYIGSIGANRPLHPDFGKDPASGVPYNVVSGNPRKTPIQVNPSESDTGPVPIPASPRREAGDDGHLLIVDQDDCRLYELFAAKPIPGGGWKADSAAYFDLRSNALRPDGWTSADAAGLPIFAGLVRYEEVAAGEIHHALRFTAPKTQRAYVWPARHYASRDSNPALPPMGSRLRLRADFDISGFSKEAQVILRALKKYGMFLADNGGPWFISGAPNPKWDDESLAREFRKVSGADFEVVDSSSLMRGPNTAAILPPDLAPPAPDPGAPSIGNCPALPADNVWNTPVDTLPLDSRSATYIDSIGATKNLHPDFGNTPTSGIPYNLVSGNRVRKVELHASGEESDTGPAPIPANPVMEAGGDGHLLVIDQDACRLYELFLAIPMPDGSWKADSAAYYDLRSNALRPEGWTSADASGLPIFPGLVRYEEVASGEIRHAIRFTAPKTQRAFIWPARHYASRDTNPALPPMGLRLRLKASFDLSGFSAQAQVILRAMKKYGMILADNGSAWFFSGAPSSYWDLDPLVTEMRKVTGADFEVVDASSLMRGPNSGAAIQPARR